MTIIQSAARRIGILTPAAVYTSGDIQVLQLLELANEEGRALARRPWTALVKQASFTTVASESQGLVSTIAPGLGYIVNDTIWDRSRRLPIIGPLMPQSWQQRLARSYLGPFTQYRILENALLFNPIPTAGNSCFFEYVTSNWCASSDGTVSRSAWGGDSDLTVLNEELMTLGIVNRFRKAKGLAYDTSEYDAYLTDLLAKDGTKPVLNMAGSSAGYSIVPEGNWPL